MLLAEIISIFKIIYILLFFIIL